MANPQKENGFTAIANESMEALARIRISGEARQIVDTIIRRTYGYQKRFAQISLQEFSLATAMNKPAVVRAINKAFSMNIIIIKKDNDGNKIYAFNKNYETWKPLSKKIMTLSKMIIEKTDETPEVPCG